MKKLFLHAVLLCASAFALTANAAVIHTVSNGKLVSASGINISGQLYNVTFGDSCATMYAGCNSALFDFTSQQQAVAAMNALFSQVLVNNVNVNGVNYNFDSNPERVKSCDYVGFCEMWIPYLDLGNNNVRSTWQINNTTNDPVGSTAWDGPYTYGNTESYMAFTNWERAAVPEPGSIALLALALAGIGFARKKKTA